jgi:hypothetical protein
MKMRHGFVSNSSSSSFVIALPKGTKMDKDKLTEVLAPKGCALHEMAVGMAKFMKENADKTTAESILSDWGYDSAEEIRDTLLRKAIEQGMDIYMGSANNDGYPDEQALSSITIEFDSPEIIVSKTDIY